MKIGSKIKKYREQINLSQEELADKVYVSRQTVSNWENNKSYPDINSLKLLSNIFDVSLDEFIKGDIEEMKKRISEYDLKEYNTLSNIFAIEFLVMIISGYPLSKIFIKSIIWNNSNYHLCITRFNIWLVILLHFLKHITFMMCSFFGIIKKENSNMHK